MKLEGWGAKCLSTLLIQQQHSSKPPLTLTSAQNLHAGSFMAGFHGLAAPLGVGGPMMIQPEESDYL